MKKDLERLVAAMIASLPASVKLDYKAIALMYGEGATYSTIEHQFRSYRKIAERMRAEAMNDGENVRYSPEAPSSRSGDRRRPSKRSAASSKKSNKQANGEDGLTTPSPTKKSSASQSPKIECIVIDDDSDCSPIKEEIKVENEMTRSLLGIRKRAAESTNDESHPKRVAQSTSPIPTTLPTLPICSPYGRVNSQSNGYASSSTLGRSATTEGGLASSDSPGSSQATGQVVQLKLEDILVEEA